MKDKLKLTKKKNDKNIILKTTIDTRYFNFLAKGSDHCTN